MAKQLKFRGGTTAEHSNFVGVLREVTVDTDEKVVVVHDGSTAGGHPMAKKTHTHTPAQAGSEPANANIQTHIGSSNNPHGTTAAQVGAETANANIQAHVSSTANPHNTTAAQVGAVPSADLTTTAIANKVLKLDANAKLPASITGDAATVGGNLPAAFATAGHGHTPAATGAAGFMSATDKAKLDGIASGATAYVHPSTDGSHHVPATGTTNNTKVLKSGSTAGSEVWGQVDYSEIANKPTIPTTLPASDVSTWAKQATKPSYNAAEVGLDKVNNTPDSSKSVNFAASATNAANADKCDGWDAAQNPAARQIPVLSDNGNLNIPSGAKFTVGGVEVVPPNKNLFSQTFNTSGVFTVPAGVTSIMLSMAGGGAGGGNAVDDVGPGGSGGGYIYQSVVSVLPNTAYPIVIGAGGAGVPQWAIGGGGAGGTTTAFGKTATGGQSYAGPPGSAGFGGNGCRGGGVVPAQDGAFSGGGICGGGAGGFGSGAALECIAEANTGAGGGGGWTNGPISGAGGSGKVIVEWFA